MGVLVKNWSKISFIHYSFRENLDFIALFEEIKSYKDRTNYPPFLLTTLLPQKLVECAAGVRLSSQPPQKSDFPPSKCTSISSTILTFLPNNPVCFYTKNSQKVHFSSNCTYNTGHFIDFSPKKSDFFLKMRLHIEHYFDFFAQ